MKNLITSVTLAALVVCSPLALAKHGMADHGLLGLKQLDLSAEQKRSLKAIMQNSREELALYSEDRQNVKQELLALMALPQWDVETVSAAIQQSIDSEKQSKLIAARTKHLAYQVLSQEQKAELDVYRDKKNRQSESKNGQKPLKNDKKRKLNMQKMFAKLDLSEQQKAELATLRAAAKSHMENHKAQHITSRNAENTIIQATTFDQDAWLSLYESNRDIMLEVGLQRAKNKYDSLALLNAEQRLKLAKLMQRSQQKYVKKRDKQTLQS